MNEQLLSVLQLFAVLLNALCGGTTEALLVVDVNTQQSKNSLKNAVKNLLNVDDYPINTEIRPKRHYRMDNAAAKYMQKLFQMYNKNKRYNSKRAIIRCINPKAEVFNNNDALSFDISSIRWKEGILKAELHLNTYSKALPVKIKAKRNLQVIGLRYGIQTKLDLVLNKSDWLGYDATRLLTDIRSRNDTVLLVQVRRKETTMKNTDILRKYTPFLLVYSTPEDDKTERDFLDAIKDEQKQAAVAEFKKRSKRGSDYYVYRSNKNQIKEDDSHLRKFRNLGPAILRRRSKHLRHSNHSKKIKVYRADPMLGFGGATESQRISVRPEERDDKSDISMILLDNAYAGEKCGKRKMTVNFDEIGWGEYVVQPTSFEANYCSGTCSFQLDKFTNSHAIFQSLMHTAGVSPYIPNVSCTPDRFDSQTLLYFHDNNLVLRTFPKMIVTSCGCN